MWLVSPESGGRILGAADTNPVMQAMLTAAQQRGIVLVFPQLDAQDKAAVGVADLASFDAGRIRAASARYQPDAVLVGVMAPAEGQLAGRWEWLSPDKVEDWQTPAGKECRVLSFATRSSAARRLPGITAFKAAEALRPNFMRERSNAPWDFANAGG